MLRNVLLSGGLFLTAATQLRIPGLPVGPGEVFLVGWLFLGLLLGPASAERHRPGLMPLALFWTLFVISQGLGMVVSFANELFFDTASAIHDIGAYVFGFAIASMLLRDLADESHRQRIVQLILSISAGGLLLQILGSIGLLKIPSIEHWYFDRLQGWSENPNMLGLLSAFIVFLAVFGIGNVTSRLQLIPACAAFAFALVAGFMTRSDSFVISILVGGTLWLGMKMWNGLTGRGTTRGSKMAAVCLIFAPLIFAAAVPFAPAAFGSAESYTKSLYEDNSQGDTRLSLWREAVDKGVESGLLGYGPGPHLTSKSFKRPPPDKFEAHNTFLDIFTQGGLLGLFAFIALIGVTFASTIRAELVSLAALSCGLLIFGFFHFVLRQPIFWFGVVLCLVEAGTVLRRKSTFSSRGQIK